MHGAWAVTVHETKEIPSLYDTPTPAHPSRCPTSVVAQTYGGFHINGVNKKAKEKYGLVLRNNNEAFIK